MVILDNHTDHAASIYAACASKNTESAEGLLLCLTEEIMKSNEVEHEAILRNREFSRNMAVVYAAALAFFMQAGFAMVCAGAVRRKNLQNTMLKNVLDACGASIAFYSVGYAFAFGDGSNPNGFIGTTNFFLRDVEDIAFWLFQYAFSAASTTIVAGTLAERCQMSAYFYYSIILSGFVYPVVVHALWSPYGFLSGDNIDPFLGVGVLDIAGSGVVHCTGGVTALVATYVLGPRRGRFHDEQTGELLDTPNLIKGHNIGLQVWKFTMCIYMNILLRYPPIVQSDISFSLLSSL
jgi:ammonia channel protein AmtB